MKNIHMLILTLLWSLISESNAQTGEIIEGPRSGGMGVGTLVMLIIVIIVVVFCVAMFVAEEATWGCIFGIIIVLIVFGILMVCPRGPIYEEVPSENEYVFKEVRLFFSNLYFRTRFVHTHAHAQHQVYNGTALVRITLLIFVTLCSAVALWIYCYFGLLDELKPGEVDYGFPGSSKQGTFSKNC